MTDITATPPASPPAAPRPWGYFATLGWVVLTYIVATLAAVGALYLLRPDEFAAMGDLERLLKDAWGFSVSTLVIAPLLTLMLMGVARLAGWGPLDYLALRPAGGRTTLIALVSLVAFLPLMDGLAWLSGQPIVTDFQIDIYRSAQKTGVLSLMWLAVVIAAPLVEEVAFRGFIYRGWVKPEYSPIPPIVVIAAFFAILHLQYNWFGIFQVFCIGLFLTGFRWGSGSTLLTFLLHALTNLYGTVQTVVKVHWLS
jgi:membrane protease YdiL (CAAX protease family)